MRKGLTSLGVAAAAVLLATSAFAANRGVTFTGIGQIANPGNFPASSVIGMNPQATEFIVTPTYFGVYCVKWTRDGGWGQEIGNADNFCKESALGTIMAGGLNADQTAYWPGTWTGVTNVWDPIPANPGFAPCGSSGLSFYDMGGDGDYAVGLTWAGCSSATGFLWSKATNATISLGTPNGKSTRANAVDADGSKVIGWTTMLQGLRRGAMWRNGTWQDLGDPNGTEPKICAGSGQACTSNSADPTYGCPGEYVHDASCQNIGTCVSGVCVGGVNAGNSCSYNSQCPGACVGGPNDGATCTYDSEYYCPSTQVCIDNPNWSDSLFKGEAYDITDDGRYACGQNYDYGDHYQSGYRMNPDGSFTEIPPPADYPDTVGAYAMSQDGKTIVGRVGNPFFGSIPFFWNEATGTQDLQLFLVEQGLDELFFWNLTDAYTVSADGTVIGGRGFNPDGWYEGFIVDISKVWVCHMPPGHPENARTLGISLADVGDHMAHGDFLGTCEFLNSGGLSRAAALRQRLSQGYSSADPGTNNVFPGPSSLPTGTASSNNVTAAPPQVITTTDDPVFMRPGVAPTSQTRRINDVRNRIQNKTRNQN